MQDPATQKAAPKATAPPPAKQTPAATKAQAPRCPSEEDQHDVFADFEDSAEQEAEAEADDELE